MQSPSQSQMMEKPTRPKIDYMPLESGGFCLDEENAAKLGVYIQKLEEGYGNSN